jgi:hypothetical protein
VTSSSVSFTQTSQRLSVIHVKCYSTSSYVVRFKRDPNFGEAQPEPTFFREAAREVILRSVIGDHLPWSVFCCWAYMLRFGFGERVWRLGTGQSTL